MTFQNMLCQRAKNREVLKAIETNPVTVENEINKIWKWYEYDLMAVNVKKS